MSTPWQPDDADLAALRALWSILKNRCRGKRRAMAKPALREMLLARGHDVAPRTMDHLTTWLRNRPQWPVVTLGEGVFWAVRRDELLEARHYLASRFDDLALGVRVYDSKIRRWDARRARALPAGDLGPGEIQGLAPRARAGQGILFDGLAQGSRT